MKYLEDIALLNSGLRMLKANSREQVSKAKLEDLQQICVSLTPLIPTCDPTFGATLIDISSAIKDCMGYESLTYLTSTMKQALVDGFLTLKRYTCLATYEYYSDNDFEVTAEVIVAMREVVDICLE